MTNRNLAAQRGFTLIEVMVVLLLTSVALLALGAFSLTAMDSGTLARERMVAVHLAQEVIEQWQHNSNDYLPSIASNCTMTDGTSAPTYPATITCTPATGPGVAYTILASTSSAQAPLPDGAGGVAFAALAATTAHPNTPVVKLVKVSWNHKGVAKSIYLTHLTR